MNLNSRLLDDHPLFLFPYIIYIVQECCYRIVPVIIKHRFLRRRHITSYPDYKTGTPRTTFTRFNNIF